MTTEVVKAETWLYGVLHGDAQLCALINSQVYAYVAPESASYPFVVYHQQAASDVGGVGPVIIAASLLYTVKAVTVGRSYSALDPIAARIHTLLHAQGGGNIIACVRESVFSLPEVDGGIEYRHLGGIYRIMVAP